MLLLAELVNRVSINAGQLVIPLTDLDLDYKNLEQIFLHTLSEYSKYKPDKKINVNQPIYVDLNGVFLPNAIRVISMRPYISRLWEFIKPNPFKSWQFDQDTKLLTSAYAGQYIIEYMAIYPTGNFDIDYIETQVNQYESDFTFKLRGHYKKGTLKILVTMNNIDYMVTEDFSSYKVIPSTFTYDIGTNILTINSTLGSQLQTGSRLEVKTTATLPSPLAINTIYYAIKLSDTQIKLANTIDEAFAGIEIDISGTNTGVISIQSVVDTPYIYLLGSMGYARLNLNDLTVELNLIIPLTGSLKVRFTSLFIAIDNLNINSDTIFTDLFQANLMMSIGLIKEILKQPDLPFDFTPDKIHDRGKELKDVTMKLLQDQSYWEFFRA